MSQHLNPHTQFKIFINNPLTYHAKNVDGPVLNVLIVHLTLVYMALIPWIY